MVKSCLFASRALPHLKSKQAARDVDHVPVLDIFWIDRFAANGGSKVNGLGALFSIDYASQMNIAPPSIIAWYTVVGRSKSTFPGLLANSDTIAVAVPLSNVTSTSGLSSFPS